MLKEFSAEIVFVCIVLFLLVQGADVFQSRVLNPDYLFDRGVVTVQEVFPKIFNNNVYSLFKTFLGFLTVFFLTIICYCLVRLMEIRTKQHHHHHHEIEEYAKRHANDGAGESESKSKNPRWNQTLTYLFSDSSSDWKLAVLEADAILDELLIDLGFKGENLGERLKMANQDNFYNLSKAWEVHNIRNKVAHEGLSFTLSHHEAKRIVAIYEDIFHHYGVI